MYRNFFNLQEKPFKLTASPEVFHDNQGITPAYKKLIKAIHSEQRLILLSGQTGTGKTLCAEKLKIDLKGDPYFECIAIPFTSLPLDEILGYICNNLNLHFGLGQDIDKLEILDRFLTHGHSPIRSVIILIDEAQNLSHTILTGLVELVKLGVRSKRNIQIVVMARNETDLNLHHSRMAEFNQHLSVKCQLEPLTFEETDSYIKYHLDMAGATDNGFFTKEATAKVFELTQGRARAINVLCDHILNTAAHEKATIITPQHVFQSHNQQKFDDTIEMDSSLISDAIKEYVYEENQVLQKESYISTKPEISNEPDTKDHSFSEIELEDTVEPLITKLNTLENTHPTKSVSNQSLPSVEDETIEFGSTIIHTNNEQLKSNTRSKFNIPLWGLISLLLIAGLLYQVNQHKILPYLESRQMDHETLPLTVEPVIQLAEKIDLPDEINLQTEIDTPIIDEKTSRTTYPPEQNFPESNRTIKENTLSENQTLTEIVQKDLMPATIIIESSEEKNSVTEIEFLLKKAKVQIASLKLTVPKDDNAYASYKSILQKDPENEQANQGIEDLKQMFIEWAKNNVKKNQFDRARHYYRKALIVDPQDQETLQALSELENKIGDTDNIEFKAGLLGLAEKANLEEIQMLLNKGAFPEVQDQKGNTPLMLATERGHVEVIETLLNNGANPNIKNNSGDTALMNAVWNAHAEIVDLLINKQANIDTANKRGWTALMYAAVQGHIEILERLTLMRANLESETDDQKTALAIAAYNGQYEIVKALLKSGAQIDTQDISGWTPLMSAAWNGYKPIVIMLLEHGADKSIATPEGDNAFELASEQSHYSIMTLLK